VAGIGKAIHLDFMWCELYRRWLELCGVLRVVIRRWLQEISILALRTKDDPFGFMLFKRLWRWSVVVVRWRVAVKDLADELASCGSRDKTNPLNGDWRRRCSVDGELGQEEV
jgi:hypothetical protein